MDIEKKFRSKQVFFWSQIENLRGHIFLMKIWVLKKKSKNFNLHPFEVWFDAKFVENIFSKDIGVLRAILKNFFFFFCRTKFIFRGPVRSDPPPENFSIFFLDLKVMYKLIYNMLLEQVHKQKARELILKVESGGIGPPRMNKG